MKIFDRYIARQLLGVTALGVMALSALLLLGNLFKELRPLLVENKAPISIVLEFIFQVIPFSLMFSIPWGFLTAVLLVYGRLASDNELTSMRMSGMSLWRLKRPRHRHRHRPLRPLLLDQHRHRAPRQAIHFRTAHQGRLHQPEGASQ